MSKCYLSRKIHGESIIHFAVGMHVAGPNDANAGGKDSQIQRNVFSPVLQTRNYQVQCTCIMCSSTMSYELMVY